jgi:hypothetical protein
MIMLMVGVRASTVPTGNMNYVQNNMFLGQLPKRLVIACVDSDALNGAIEIGECDGHFELHPPPLLPV